KSPTVILQGHLDMVHQKNKETVFDFGSQGIDMYLDGDWVKARGTTLGADNGLGVASIMAVLASKDLSHPAIEALFTLDEETGMTGAKALGRKLLKGKILLNLDTEEDHVFTIGCAGGIDTLIEWNYREMDTPAGSEGRKIVVNGLKGGHSGVDIHLGRGNANKLMNRVLMACKGAAVSTLEGGSVRNAIPRESTATVAVKSPKVFDRNFKAVVKDILDEYSGIEPGLQITVSEAPVPAKVMRRSDQAKLLSAIRAAHNGVFRMSPDVPGLVETSSNLARVEVQGGRFFCGTLQRSSIESGKADVAATLRAPFDLLGAKIENDNAYPGWKPNPKSAVLKKMEGIYERQFGHKPQVEACHAGLECGIISEAYPGLDMISFGPEIRNAHSPDECASVSSFQKFWGFLVEVLKQI
ncbi:MAG: aminoacyl-histidine dipeptidase, partial [Saprospiraceae bacterium]|nr:aminoacyl-histidine dipeptidase [Saprospiraceae bacterium]